MTVHVGGLTSFSDEAIAQELLARRGLDILDPHGEDTPRRWVSMMLELTTETDYANRFTVFPNTEGIDEMVVLSPIPFYTLCAHHVIPFYGVAHIAYVPDGLIAGLSKFARVVEGVAKGFHVQETLTVKIADFLYGELDPLGLGVVLQAEHLCMAMRGVQKPGVMTTTSSMRGVFADHKRTAKAEFLALVSGGKR